MEGCETFDIEWHHVSKLNRMEVSFGNVSVVTKKGKRVTGTDAFRVVFNRKQFPLCNTHHADLHRKRLSFSEINGIMSRRFLKAILLFVVLSKTLAWCRVISFEVIDFFNSCLFNLNLG